VFIKSKIKSTIIRIDFAFSAINNGEFNNNNAINSINITNINDDNAIIDINNGVIKVNNAIICIDNGIKMSWGNFLDVQPKPCSCYV